MDVFYQFGKLMNLDPCDEKVQKAAEELHEITGGQKQVVKCWMTNIGRKRFASPEETDALNLPGRSCGNSIKQDRNRCFSYIIFRKFLLISA